MQCGPDADRIHIWTIEITEFLVFALVSFLAPACSDHLTPGDLPIVSDVQVVFMPMFDRLSRWIDGLGSFIIIYWAGIDHLLAYVLLSFGPGVGPFCADLGDLFFSAGLEVEEVIHLADKRGQAH